MGGFFENRWSLEEGQGGLTKFKWNKIRQLISGGVHKIYYIQNEGYIHSLEQIMNTSTTIVMAGESKSQAITRLDGTVATLTYSITIIMNRMMECAYERDWVALDAAATEMQAMMKLREKFQDQLNWVKNFYGN